MTQINNNGIFIFILKISSFHISKNPAENLTVEVARASEFYNKFHEHEEIQISYIFSGRGKLLLSDAIMPFAPEQLYVFGEHMPHVFHSDNTPGTIAHMVSVFFSPSSFGKDFFKLEELREILPFFEKSAQGFTLEDPAGLYAAIFRKLPNSSLYDKFIALLKLLQLLAKDRTYSLSQKIQERPSSSREGERLQLIYEYIGRQYHQRVSLEEVAKLIFMTPNSFCRFFKAHANKTFFEVLTEYRIAHACQLLRSLPSHPISEIAEQSGFSSLTHFNRKFKKQIGLTPTSYRNQQLKGNNQPN